MHKTAKKHWSENPTTFSVAPARSIATTATPAYAERLRRRLATLCDSRTRAANCKRLVACYRPHWRPLCTLDCSHSVFPPAAVLFCASAPLLCAVVQLYQPSQPSERTSPRTLSFLCEQDGPPRSQLARPARGLIAFSLMTYLRSSLHIIETVAASSEYGQSH